MLDPAVFNTAQICHQLGVKHAVMSPGSRNAPLTISFARNTKIEKWIIPDERAAGFIALGIAQETNTPVVLCCTSGTALLNYAPAIAEAYYREIPLVVLSADRPPALIDQRDGQTIRQFEALKNHVKKSVQLPLINSQEESEVYSSKLKDALLLSGSLPIGPVHINIPFAEPFYPEDASSLAYKEVLIPKEEKPKNQLSDFDTTPFQKVLILVGQQSADEELSLEIAQVSDLLPVLKFPLNNLSSGIEQADIFIQNQKELQPDLLITSGLSVLSKKLKLFLRANTPSKHIHLDQAGVEVDTFQSNPELIKASLTQFLKNHSFTHINPNYRNLWVDLSERSKTGLASFMNEIVFSESSAAYTILKSIPEHSNLHLSNSMPVRFADMFGVPKRVTCFSNRGTSGIDGCTSTAFGTSLVSKKLNTLLTGDLAFLYDRNAFFHNYHPSNLRIIILNNQGGGIFRLIDGPSKLEELEAYFETRHNRTAEYICAENDLEYCVANDMKSLNDQLGHFYQPSEKAKVLEVFTDPDTNQHVYKELKNYINERIKN